MKERRILTIQNGSSNQTNTRDIPFIRTQSNVGRPQQRHCMRRPSFFFFFAFFFCFLCFFHHFFWFYLQKSRPPSDFEFPTRMGLEPLSPRCSFPFSVFICCCFDNRIASTPTPPAYPIAYPCLTLLLLAVFDIQILTFDFDPNQSIVLPSIHPTRNRDHNHNTHPITSTNQPTTLSYNIHTVTRYPTSLIFLPFGAGLDLDPTPARDISTFVFVYIHPLHTYHRPLFCCLFFYFYFFYVFFLFF